MATKIKFILSVLFCSEKLETEKNRIQGLLAGLNQFQIRQIELIASAYPFSFVTVINCYIDCNKSFDETVKELEKWN